MSNSSEPGHKSTRRWIWLSAILVIGILTFVVIRHQEKISEAKNAKPPVHPIPVSTTVAKTGDIGVYLDALGSVIPRTLSNITPRVQGQITQVFYKEGQFVHKGDKLVEIDPRPYQGVVLQAEGQLEHDKALLKQSQIDLERYKKAYVKNAIPKQQLDDQVQIVFQNAGTVKADEGTLANAKVNLEYCNIIAPVDGLVGLRLVDKGNTVAAFSTNALVVVTEIQPIDVVFSLSEDHVDAVQAQIRTGKNLEVDVYDRTQQKKISTGNLLTLDNVIDPTTGTVKLKAEFPNKEKLLFPNQFVNARLLVETKTHQVLVPTAAIQHDVQGAFVYVVTSDQVVKLRKVQSGVTDGKVTAVEGLKEDEVVALDGFDKLQDGIKVSVKNEEKANPPEVPKTLPPGKPMASSEAL